MSGQSGYYLDEIPGFFIGDTLYSVYIPTENMAPLNPQQFHGFGVPVYLESGFSVVPDNRHLKSRQITGK